jgi:hypothetical protein
MYLKIHPDEIGIQTMKQVFITGNQRECSKLIEELVKKGISVTLLPQPIVESPISLLLVSADNENTGLFSQIDNNQTYWMAWCHGTADLISQAYDFGAAAAFPHETEVATLCQYIERRLDQNIGVDEHDGRRWLDVTQRRFKRGDLILLDSDVVLEINQGVIAKMMIHKDGCEVMLGLFGKESLLLPHPSDDCYIQLVAHTDCVVNIQSLESRKRQEDFTDQLQISLQRAEAWAAMQARPHLDLRLLGILSLLADEFGRTTFEGRLLDIRLTHAQLASATGSTRATITRTISDLKKQGKLTVVSTEDGERVCLLAWDSCIHSSHRRTL